MYKSFPSNVIKNFLKNNNWSFLNGSKISHGHVTKPVGGEVSNVNEPSHWACTLMLGTLTRLIYKCDCDIYS